MEKNGPIQIIFVALTGAGAQFYCIYKLESLQRQRGKIMRLCLFEYCLSPKVNIHNVG